MVAVTVVVVPLHGGGHRLVRFDALDLEQHAVEVRPQLDELGDVVSCSNQLLGLDLDR